MLRCEYSAESVSRLLLSLLLKRKHRTAGKTAVLFLEDLQKEFDSIRAIQVKRTRDKKLEEFQNKLASLTFFDPACGSGNFLTETYLSLRRLENEVI